MNLSLFCIPTELDDLIELVLVKYGYVKTVHRISPREERIFLHPPLPKKIKFEDASPRARGWIDISTCILTENILSLTEISGESAKGAKVQAPSIIRWLKSQVKNKVSFGVIGQNSNTGRSSKYKDISYTEEAKALLSQGYQWKQNPNFSSIFLPDSIE